MTASIALLATVDLLVAYLPLIGERVGISAGVIGILLSLRAASSVLSRVLLGRLAQRFSRTALITASTLVTAVLVPMLAFMPEPVVDRCAAGGPRLLSGPGSAPDDALITTAVAPGARGAALAIRMLGNKSGQVAVPAIIAAATVVVGVSAGFVLLGAILAAATFGALRSA
jgi:sugar phosphate permease